MSRFIGWHLANEMGLFLYHNTPPQVHSKMVMLLNALRKWFKKSKWYYKTQ